jgi:GT2 family glycosyltransferase
MNPKISASLVLYNSDRTAFSALIDSFVKATDGEMIVFDNSKSPLISDDCSQAINYIFNNKNIGFGPAHNLSFKARRSTSKYHLIVNPDILINELTLNLLINYLDLNEDVGVVMPKVLYPSGEVQHLCKLLPTPIDLVVRRFIPFSFFQRLINNKYVLSNLPQNTPSEVPLLSGCFLLVRSEVFEFIGGFDERFPLYMEDFDLIRRIGEVSRVVYYPLASVTHGYRKGSYKNLKLLTYHIYSACRYFNKWGWFNDKYRSQLNSKALTNLSYRSG